MRLSRLRSGEIVAGLGAVALIVALFLDWFEQPLPVFRRIDPGDAVDAVGISPPWVDSGWGSLGWLALVPIVVAVLCGLALVLATLAERTPVLPLAIGVMTVPWALLAILAILVRLMFQPGDDAHVDVRWATYLGLAGALAILLGAWRALADERTDTPEAIAQTERALSVRGAPRPAPPLDSRRDDRP